MAILFLGSSECSICKKVLKETDDIIGWQAFLKSDHKFWEYSDSGMHKICFEKWEYKDEFEFLYNYKPELDFNDPYIKEMINKNGFPDWLKKVQEFRKNHPEFKS